MKKLQVTIGSCRERSKYDEQRFLVSAKCLFKLKILAFEMISTKVCMSEEIVEETYTAESGNVREMVRGSCYTPKTVSLTSNSVIEIKPYNTSEEDSISIAKYDSGADNFSIRTQLHIQTNSVEPNTIGSKPLFKRQKDENDRFAHFAKRFCSRSLKNSRNANNLHKFENVVTNNTDKVMLHVKTGFGFNANRQRKRKRDNSLSEVINENETELRSQTPISNKEKRLKFGYD